MNANELDFIQAYELGDALFTEMFEGLPPRYNWTDDEMAILYQMQVEELRGTRSPESHKVMFSDMTRPFLNMMKNIVTPGSVAEESLMYPTDVKYLIYSAHDTNIVNILTQLNPTNYELWGVNYAASIYYELHKSDKRKCKKSEDPACFSVKIRYNNDLL